jgi:Flp pilus assembly pilin Flp
MLAKLNHVVVSLVTRAQLPQQDGQALVEYTVILGIVSIAGITLLLTVGQDIEAPFKAVIAGFEKA